MCVIIVPFLLTSAKFQALSTYGPTVFSLVCFCQAKSTSLGLSNIGEYFTDVAQKASLELNIVHLKGLSAKLVGKLSLCVILPHAL